MDEGTVLFFQLCNTAKWKTSFFRKKKKEQYARIDRQWTEPIAGIEKWLLQFTQML